METSTPYAPPVDRLLAPGEERARQRPWPDYPAEYGLGAEHIPELIRLATDMELWFSGGEGPEIWAPLHAWRALGQLRAEAAVEPLLGMLDELADEDWALEELPVVFARIGAAAIPPLAEFLAGSTHALWARVASTSALEKIAEADPSAREAVVAALTRQLGKWYRQDKLLNAHLIHVLVELGAREAAPLMEEAFAADRVDIALRGDWEDVQVDLGLLPERRTVRPPLHPELEPLASLLRERLASRPSPGSSSRPVNQAKAKRKLARQSRKRNRKRKK